MNMNGRKYIMIILLLQKKLFSKYFLFKSKSGKFLVKHENISSSGCEDDTNLANPLRNKKEAFEEQIMRGKDYFENNEGQIPFHCKCGIANEEKQNKKKNRILYPTEVKHNTYPWVVQIFLYRK